MMARNMARRTILSLQHLAVLSFAVVAVAPACGGESLTTTSDSSVSGGGARDADGGAGHGALAKAGSNDAVVAETGNGGKAASGGGGGAFAERAGSSGILGEPEGGESGDVGIAGAAGQAGEGGESGAPSPSGPFWADPGPNRICIASLYGECSSTHTWRCPNPPTDPEFQLLYSGIYCSSSVVCVQNNVDDDTVCPGAPVSVSCVPDFTPPPSCTHPLGLATYCCNP